MALRKAANSRKINKFPNSCVRITTNDNDCKIIQSPDMMPDQPNDDQKDTKFSLMESIIILGTNDQLGYLSFWNDSISSGLRGAILIELALLGKIEINRNEPKRYGLERTLIVIDNSPVGDSLLDETIRIIKDSMAANSISCWIDLLTGETWNPLNIQYQLKNVRERISKSLADKGILLNDKHSFIIFDLITHPVSDISFKKKLIKRVQKSLLSNEWGGNGGEPTKIPLKDLALIGLIYSSDIVDDIFIGLNEVDYNTSFERLRKISSANIGEIVQNFIEKRNMVNELDKDSQLYYSSCEVIWTVFNALFDK